MRWEYLGLVEHVREFLASQTFCLWYCLLLVVHWLQANDNIQELIGASTYYKFY